MRGQEVRSADNTVVVPLDLRLPQGSESEKYAAYMLGLSFPFPLCSQECASSESCFSCHSLRIDEYGGKISARFSPSWRHWRACVQTRTASAQERILGGLSSPVIRDVVGVRSGIHFKTAMRLIRSSNHRAWCCGGSAPHAPTPILHLCRCASHTRAGGCLSWPFCWISLHSAIAAGALELHPVDVAAPLRAASRCKKAKQQPASRGALCLHFQAEEHGDLEEDDGSVDIEGHDVQDGLESKMLSSVRSGPCTLWR